MPLLRALPSTRDQGYVRMSTMSLPEHRSLPEQASVASNASLGSAPAARGLFLAPQDHRPGDCVEVFSRSQNCWLPATIQHSELQDHAFSVVFTLEGQKCKKNITPWNVRKPESSTPKPSSQCTISSMATSISTSMHNAHVPPKALYVVSPTQRHHAECSGLYRLETKAGDGEHPLWHCNVLDDGRWIYYADGLWHVGDREDKEAGTGCLHSARVSIQDFPDKVPEGTWCYDRRGKHVNDPTISITSIDSLKARLDDAQKACSDKKVLQVIREILAWGVPKEVLDSVFPMCMYVSSPQTPCCSGKYDLVLEEDTRNSLMWKHVRKTGAAPTWDSDSEGSADCAFKVHKAAADCVFRVRKAGSDSGGSSCEECEEIGGRTRWMVASSWAHRFGDRGVMELPREEALPCLVTTQGKTAAEQWLDADGQGSWLKNATGIVTSRCHAKANLEEAMEKADFEWLRAAVKLAEVAQLSSVELESGKQALHKAFDIEKEATVARMASRGVSLRQMLTFYQNQVCTHLGNPDATTREVVIEMVTGYTKAKQSSLSEQLNNCDTDSCNESKCPKHHIVHSWNMKHCDVLKGLVYFVTGYRSKSLDVDEVGHIMRTAGLDPIILDEHFFFCGYCVNQHISCDEVNPDNYLKRDHPRCETNVFEEVAQRIHEHGGDMIVTLDEDFNLLKRIWCLDEIHEALDRNMKLEFTTSKIAKLEEKHFADVQKCDCRMSADRDRILEKIKKGIGFDAFNIKVKYAIRENVEQMRRKASEEPLDCAPGTQWRLANLEDDHRALKKELQSLKQDHEELKRALVERTTSYLR